MITLFQFDFPYKEILNPSSYCMKVELFLRMAKIDYKIQWENNPQTGPMNKLPYIVDDYMDEGPQIIADSNLIIRHLIEHHNAMPDKHLTAKDHAVGLSITRMLDEHFYWVIIYDRWVLDHNWPMIESAMAKDLPPILNKIIPKIIRKQLKKAAYGQGLSRHSLDEVFQQAYENMAALNAILGDDPFFFGAEPCRYDAVVCANLAQIYLTNPDQSHPKLREAAESFPKLRAHCQRMKEAYFSNPTLKR